MKYRAEIDGLRALAVVPVILFHAGFEVFSGGFVGVDVFFVISGYLITTILIEDIENQRFSILNFYERRARRILPALFFVMLVCIPFAWAWMLPSQMEDFSQSIVAVSLFSSNILFWKESGYFDAAAEAKPLLHTWSLAVEEQYYLLFPIFLFFAWRFGKNSVLWMVVVLAAISLALSEWGWRNNPIPNFYLAPTRAWELFAGSISAFIVLKRGVKASNVLSLLGLTGIMIAIFAYDESIPFPSSYALLPVLGVVLLILFADTNTLVAKILSTKIFVGIGLISYSAYLWHQPLFAFSRVYSLEPPSDLLMLILSILSIILAVFSWRFVEKPFRIKSKMTKYKIYWFSAIGLLLFVSFGIGGHITGGFEFRFSKALIVQLNEFELDKRPKQECSADFIETNLEKCLFGDINSPIRVIAIGDSHIGQWSDVLEELATANGIRIEVIAKSSCAIAEIEYVYEALGREYTECTIWRSSLIDYLQSEQPDVVLVQNSSMGYINDQVSIQDWANGLENVADKLSTIPNVLWIQDNPRFSIDVGKCFERRLLFQEKNATCSESREKALSRSIRSTEQFVFGAYNNFAILDFSEFFCDNTTCEAVRNGIPLMSDTNHMSQSSVRELKGRLLAEINMATLPEVLSDQF